MKQRGNICLSSFDDIFSNNSEDIQIISIKKIDNFLNHPFKVLENEEMQNLIQSIKELGVLTPVIIRPKNDRYEMISGHRRLRATILAGNETIPAIVKDIDDDTATLFMIDTNLQREHILPSEKARAYKIKMEVLKHQGKPTSSQLGTKLRADEIIAKDENTSRNQVNRYMRLNYLIDELLELVDSKKIAFNPAVEMSYINTDNQNLIYEFIKDSQVNVSLSQALQLKNLDKENILTADRIRECLMTKKSTNKIVFDKKDLQQYFPKNYTIEKIQETILSLLEKMKLENIDE